MANKKKIVVNFKAQVDKKMDREKRDITYAQISEETKLSSRTIARLYHGQIGRMKLLETLCNYFECQPGDLLRME